MNSKWDKLKEKLIETNYVKLLKSKERSLKAARKKQLAMYIGSLKRLTADLF